MPSFLYPNSRVRVSARPSSGIFPWWTAIKLVLYAQAFPARAFIVMIILAWRSPKWSRPFRQAPRMSCYYWVGIQSPCQMSAHSVDEKVSQFSTGEILMGEMLLMQERGRLLGTVASGFFGGQKRAFY